MNYTVLEVHEGQCIAERDSSVSASLKRDSGMINKDSVRYAISNSIKEYRGGDGKFRKAKKFRAEWMEEEHLKDWLQPFPGDDTMCVCTACNVLLRCGKSELEKHATGLKHTMKVERMKSGAHQICEENRTHAHSNDQSTRLEQLLNVSCLQT